MGASDQDTAFPPNIIVKRNAVQLYYTMDTNSVIDRLAGLPVPDLRYFDSIGSTNNEALHWAEQGAPDGALVVADRQTAGRGRMDRRWVTHPGVALAFSLILRPTPAEAAALGMFSPLGALAVATALVENHGLPAQVKWPNDVLLNRRKVCGILVEAAWMGSTVQNVVVGIGVNVAPQAVPPDDQVIFPATSVEDALGSPVDRLELLRKILAQVFDWRARLGGPDFMQAWDAHLAFKEEWVEVQPPGQPAVTGKLAGLALAGDLRLTTPAGTVITVAAGDLRPAAFNDNDASMNLGG
jgi:BirA family transcriptional regulator, biotin operon repressor / biotin---[acetyl-CoA-carboxylase] ligase